MILCVPKELFVLHMILNLVCGLGFLVARCRERDRVEVGDLPFVLMCRLILCCSHFVLASWAGLPRVRRVYFGFGSAVVPAFQTKTSVPS